MTSDLWTVAAILGLGMAVVVICIRLFKRPDGSQQVSSYSYPEESASQRNDKYIRDMSSKNRREKAECEQAKRAERQARAAKQSSPARKRGPQLTSSAPRSTSEASAEVSVSPRWRPPQ